MDNRVKHSPEVRAEAARLIAQGYGKRNVARALGISLRTADHFVLSFRQGRLLGLTDVESKHKKYSYELKLAAVQRFLAGTPNPQVCLEFEIPGQSILRRWVRDYRAAGPDGLKPKPKGRPRKDDSVRPETQEEKIARLEFEIEALKKLQALVALERRRKPKR